MWLRLGGAEEVEGEGAEVCGWHGSRSTPRPWPGVTEFGVICRVAL